MFFLPRNAARRAFPCVVKGTLLCCLCFSFFVAIAYAGTITITPNLPTATASLPYLGTLAVSGGKPPYQFSSTMLPPGLEINDANGNISGTPNSQGTYSFTVTVTDKPNHDSGQGTFSITVDPKPVVSVTITPATAMLHTYRSLQFTAVVNNAQDQSVTWETTAGTISSSGLLTAPFVYINTPVTVTATSVAFPTKQSTAAITVTPESLRIFTNSIPYITAGVPFSFVLSANGGFPPYTWSVISGALPSGLSIENASSTLAGTTDQVGQANFTLQVTDSTRTPLKSSVAMTATVLRNPAPEPASFFGLQISTLKSPWPNSLGIPFTGYRSIASHINWSDINTAEGVYDWSLFDSWMSNVETYHQSFLYTIFSTPTWASSNPTDPCTGSFLPNGGCDPPNDLNADGTGTDDHLKEFVGALIMHAGVGKIKYLEVWDEPNIPQNWTGTYAQLVRMTHDISQIAKRFDRSVLVGGPPETGDGTNNTEMNWLAGYLAAGGVETMDVLDFHCYAYQPEDLVPRIQSLQSVALTYGQQSKPVFCTEGSWGQFNNLTDFDQQAAFIARQMMILFSEQISQFYWYAWDTTDSGNLYSPGTGELSGAGNAYLQLHKWILGAASSGACAANGTVWTCNLTRAGGYQAMAVWDSSQTCDNGVCTYSTFTVPPPYVQYHDLNGNLFTNIGSQVSIGLEPILLENMSAF
jgi:Putative Ig domain